jgi:hypothetical protein
MTLCGKKVSMIAVVLVLQAFEGRLRVAGRVDSMAFSWPRRLRSMLRSDVQRLLPERHEL